MAELAQARRVTSFDGKIYVKGFSTVLVPTQKTGDLLSWHLRYNADGSHLSYLDDRIPAIQQDYPQGCEIFDLKNFRHILGWASAVKCHVGRPDANYALRWTGPSGTGKLQPVQLRCEGPHPTG